MAADAPGTAFEQLQPLFRFGGESRFIVSEISVNGDGFVTNVRWKAASALAMPSQVTLVLKMLWNCST